MPDLYDSFKHHGYRIEAWMPASSSDPLQWTIKAVRDGTVVKEMVEPMTYPPLFGPDVADVSALEEATERFLTELSESSR
jgi:hypothetical protein